MATRETKSDVQPAGAPPGADPRRWKALFVLSALQFMILLDMTIVNVALPAIEDGMDFTPAGLTWVVNGYALAAGALLILGGRLADYFGRRRLLIIGVVLFAVSSALCGLATHAGVMILGRFGQGAAEAIAAPASLGLIALLFTDPKERSKALGVWGGLVALGGEVAAWWGRAEADRRTVGELQTALNTRVIVEQAKGFLAARALVTPEQAFSLLRQRARSSNRRLDDVAREVMAGGEIAEYLTLAATRPAGAT